MATQRHIWAYIGITVLVTWLAWGLIPELQAGQVPVPAAMVWLVRSVVPALVVLTTLLPSVVSRPANMPSVTSTTTAPTPPALPPIAASVPAPAIPEPPAPVEAPKTA